MLSLCILISLISLQVIITNNPIKSVIALIFVYFLTVILFIFLGTEFLAFIIFIVYVGAISILFLFVIMLLNLRVVELYTRKILYLPFGGILLLFSTFFFFYILSKEFILSFEDCSNNKYNFKPLKLYLLANTNIKQLGELLYNYNAIFVLLIALILLVAMVGAIILVSNSKEDVIKISANIPLFEKTALQNYNI